MKVLLINPEVDTQNTDIFPKEMVFAPLNLQILASLTPLDVDLEIVDENFEDINFEGNYDLVGITSCTSFINQGIIKVCEEFKMRSVPIILGGLYPSLNPQRACLQFDSVAIGECESLWPRVLDDLRKERLKRVYKSKKPVDLNKHAYPLPRRDLTLKKKYYSQTVEISRGCPYKCDFCVIPHLNCGTYRCFPIKRVVEDVINAIQSNAVPIKNYVYLSDNNLVINPEYKIRLLKALIPYNLIWFSHADINIVKNKRLLDAASKSGCYGLWMGFESLNQNNLQNINKRHVLGNDYKKAVKIIHDYGIKVQGLFMFGMDADKKGIGKKTLEFANEIGLDSIKVRPIIPMRGTKLFKRLKKEKRITTEGNLSMSQFKMKNLSWEDLSEEINYVDRHKKLLFKPNICNKNIRLSTRVSYFLHYRIKYFDWKHFLWRR